ncbi:TetR/AcrR family transcriptional regulator [Paraglaciecola sp. L1A13]|uniref:TetR/AcrR family transcriptional regulator n=1 Tax=Paraglaciecola sp. L1A13 TaxID=2686359 RepID=UPI00131D2E7D|nr:TetR/AcrR family transcriptional regulator [Paraglaciecola sp. L1A13]|tara:strand:- start:2159 stop:2800 length:642 start_codon:yes stop_codon:yes gene_type:complete
MPKVLSDDEIRCFRNRMCDHALASFAKHGVDGISLRGLAADLSCSRTTPYRYFKNKADILAALRQREFGRIADALEAALLHELNPSKQLETLCSAYFQFAIENPDSYRVMYTVAQPDPSQYGELEAEILRSSEPMRRIVNNGLAAGSMLGDPINICYVLWAGLHGLISLHLAHLLGNKREIDELAAVMIRSLLRAVSAESSELVATDRINKPY